MSSIDTLREAFKKDRKLLEALSEIASEMATDRLSDAGCSGSTPSLKIKGDDVTEYLAWNKDYSRWLESKATTSKADLADFVKTYPSKGAGLEAAAEIFGGLVGDMKLKWEDRDFTVEMHDFNDRCDEERDPFAYRGVSRYANEGELFQKTVRLAFENPSLRPHLLPLLKK